MSSRILKPTGDSRGAISSKRSRRIMKKPDMGSESGVPTSRVGQPGRQPGNRAAACRRSWPAAAFDIAGGRHQIGLAALQPRQHRRQHFLVMLQIGVDHRDIRARRWTACLRCRRPPGRGGPPGGGSAPGDRGAAISFTAAAVPSGELSSTKIASQATPAERQVQPAHQFGDIAPLLEGGHDHRQRRCHTCVWIGGQGRLSERILPW